ncbi:MAG: PAS domain S-box protein [Desulfobacteraceae bacterium]|nr:MAG: PAS domain S-box protein [Desulfobacteraceae bacterium]
MHHVFSRLKSSHRSISKEVTMGLVITVILVSTISFLAAHLVARAKARQYLNAKADEYILYLKEILILPIWNYDYDTIDVIGKSFMQNEDIAGITITDSRGTICVKETHEDMIPMVRRHADLERFKTSMGSVEISLASGYYNIWNRQLFGYFGFIILINLLSLIIMSGFLLRWSLNKPLHLLNRIVASYNSRKKGEDIPDHMPYSEFLPLIDTLKGMGNEIQVQMDELQKAEKKYRSIFENAMEGIFQSTLDGRIIDANPAFASILGYDTPEELMHRVENMGRQHWVDPEQRRTFLELLKQNSVTESFEVQFKKRDSTVIWVSLSALPIFDDQGTIMHIEGLVQDITTRKKAQIELTRLSSAVEQVAESIIIADDLGRIKYVNPAFENSTGFQLNEVYNQPNRVLGADESEKKSYDQVLDAVQKGEVWTGRLTTLKKTGELLVEDAIVSPIKSPAGLFLGYVSVNRDVTLKVRYENQVRQAQKMEAIGTLAGGIAHDFNNILGVIIGCSELVRKNLSQEDKAVQDIEQVLTAGLRAKSLVSQILTFSRQEETKKIPLTLSPFIREVIHFLKATLPNFVRIDYRKEIDSGVVLADPTQIQQILMNICTNSAQAIGQKQGCIEVILSQKEFAPEDDRPPDSAPGTYVMIEIRDDGPGISQEIQDKIFDPFFTTKEVGEGTGLGLSVVHGIVKKHEGTIQVSSEEGQGTCFTILLPRLEHRDIRISIPQVSDLPTGTERVLLVDDEETLLHVLERILSNQGYEVEAHADSRQALASFKGKSDYFDLVVTDQVMPEMTGSELVSRIRELNSHIPVILLTGFNEVRLEKTDENRPRFDRVLKKPLMNSDLAFTIRKVLDEQHKES